MKIDQGIGSIIVLTLVSFLIIGFKILEFQADKNAIRQNLEKKKTKNIVISKEWIDFDKGTRTYYVSYTDEDGKQHSRVCKLHFGDIYWSDEEKQA